MTTEQRATIRDHASNGNLSDYHCRMIVHYMMGYLTHATNLEHARDEFFHQIDCATKGKLLPDLSCKHEDHYQS